MASHGSRNERDGITSRFRLRGYDYSHPGYYFATVCIENRAELLGTVLDGRFSPSPAGEMVHAIWHEQAARFAGIELDQSCVMPNHFHALVGIGTLGTGQNASVSIPTVMQGFKAATTVAYGHGVRNDCWPPYEGRLWQKGYHDHIVRNDRDLDRIREYIIANPSLWERDTFYSVALD